MAREGIRLGCRPWGHRTPAAPGAVLPVDQRAEPIRLDRARFQGPGQLRGWALYQVWER
ncbi:MAG: hypothetical protein RLY70_639 [Planctomycetota bacterium]